MENNRKAGVIKFLLNQGLAEKHVVMIMQAQQSYVNKIKNKKLHVNTDAIEDGMTSEENARYDAVKKIISAKELPTNGTDEQDKIYIHLLKFFMVPKEQIRALYNHIAISRVDRILRKKDIDLGNFDSTLLGIPREVYLDLIIDYIE